MVLSELYLPVKGGHVMWLHEVCKRMSNVQLLTNKVRGTSTNELLDDIIVHRIHLNRSILLRPESLFLYGNLLVQGFLKSIKDRPKTILSARIIPEGVVGNIIGRLFGIHSVVFAHGEEINRQRIGTPLPIRRRRTAMLKRKFLWTAYKWADLIIANSHFTKNLLLEGGINPGKIAVVHPGTDPDRFRPLPRNDDLISQLDLSKKKVILSVGRLTPRKGQDTVIRALPKILKCIPNAVYVIGGTGSYLSELKSLAVAMGVRSSVRFIGEVTDELLPHVYNIADVFIMANRIMHGSNDIEGFGIVFLEANACEVPVIGGKSGGVPDAINDDVTGLLIQGHSKEDVSDALIKLLTNPELAKALGKAGRERVCRELTWTHSTNKINNYINKLIHNF
ncbi:glycosyltransferase family 4 protein [Desulfobacter hydrogenophilus]|uniref:glycosyltransferase family 4 protein n=1 Tax=Desulfobacter hydrogenophilus TaxID=2291 RepID=UPI0013EFB0D5|nr:glycosyltransferase family 4 protein [Desulfobacter hydrogenophilus]